MQGSVGAPGPPGFGAGRKFGRRGPLAGLVGESSHQANVGGWEGVGLTQFAHGDVLRGPFADARQGLQRGDGVLERALGAEDQRIGGDGVGHRLERRGP